MSYKKDKKLGMEIGELLKKKGLENPLREKKQSDKMSIAAIVYDLNNVLTEIGLNLEDDAIKKTPKRVATMYVEQLFYGLDYANFPKCSTFDNDMKYSGMVIIKDIAVVSTCEHHFMPIIGKAKIAYIPNGKVLGLSKFNRVVDFFARRPQIQERLIEQIYEALAYILKTEDVAITIQADHYCVIARGVKDINSSTVTTRLGGSFMDSEGRIEFMTS